MTSSNQNSDYVSALSCGSLTVREPIKIAQGVSEWRTFTPVLSTGALGTGGSTIARYRIIGQTLELHFIHSQVGGGTTGSGIYTLSLPTGCVALWPAGSCGSGYIYGSSVQVPVIPELTSTTGLIFFIIDTAATTLAAWNSGSNANILLGVGTALTVSFTARIPLNPTSPILRQ